MLKLDSTQMDLVHTNLDKDGKLSCLKAFKVAKLIGMKPKDMAEVARSMDIKISNCELGVFGKLPFTELDDEIYTTLVKGNRENKKVACEVAWKLAQDKGQTLRTVASSIKKSDIKVSKCQLGLFEEEELYHFEMSSN
jgi:hypothetical protein